MSPSERPAAPSIAHGGTSPLAAQTFDWDLAYVEQLPRVYNYFRSIVHSQHDAQHEVEQRTTRAFEQAWRARKHYRGDRAGFEARLLAIAHEIGHADTHCEPANSHRSPSEPPAAFAARLRARLEALELAEQLSARQRRLYGVLGSVLVLVLIVLATPPLRNSTQRLLQQWQAPWKGASGTSALSASTASELPPVFEPDSGAQNDLGLGAESSLESRAIYPRHRAHSAADRSAVSQPTSAQHSQQLFSVPAALRPTAPGAVAGDAPVRLGGSKLALLLVSFKTAALRVASLRSLPHEAAFKQLCRGELDVVASARPMTRAALAECAAASSEFIELPLAYAGVVVLENYDNVWADPLRAETLTGLIGNAQTAPARLWSDLGKYWPEVDARLYVLRETRGLGELFEELFGEPGRNLLTNEIGLRRSEAELLRAVREDPYAIALLPMGYYLENEAHLPTFTRGTRVVDAFGNAVRPSAQSIASRYYLPLSRLLFLYVNAAAANRPAVQGFVRSALEPQAEWISQSVFFGLEPEQYQQALHKFAERRVGSIFGRDQLDGLTAGEILRGRAFPRPY